MKTTLPTKSMVKDAASISFIQRMFSIIIIVFSILISSSYANNTKANSPLGTVSKLYTNLFAIANDGSALMADGVASCYYAAYHDAVDNQDALKLNSFNTKESLSILRDGSQLSIEKRQPIVSSDTTFLDIEEMDVRAYKLQFVGVNFADGISAELKDAYTGSVISISLNAGDTTNYAFSIFAGDTASSNPQRFMIVYSVGGQNQPLSSLPVKYKNISAFNTDAAINVEWSVENELNVKNYLVEKSTDGIHFSDIATVAPGAETLEYNYEDQSSNALSFYYRIASVDDNGLSTYSSIVKVSSIVNDQSSVKLYPTVIQNGSINLQINNNISGQYILNVINNLGQTVLQKEINHPQGVSVDNISLGNSLQKGMMNIVVIAPNKTINTSKIFVR